MISDTFSILDEARSVALAQGGLGTSPAETRDGKTLLCAASCLAVAAFRIAGRDVRASDFFDSLRNTNDSEVLRAAFSELGWSDKVCAEVQAANDVKCLEDRMNWFLAENVCSELSR
jgi:hypothetical protein